MRKFPFVLILILLLAVELRLDGLRSNTLQVLDGDAADYHRIAENLLTGKGYVQVAEFAYGRQPGWPLLLTAVYGVSGVHPEIGVWALSLIGMLSVALTWQIGRNIGGERVGILAALFVAIDPFLIVQDQTLLSESLYTLIFLAAFWTLIYKRGAAFGFLAGLLMLVRSNGFGILIGLLWLPRRKAIIAIGVLGIVLLPWVVRNWSVAGTLSPFAPQTGQLLLGSYNDFTLNQPEAFGMWLYPKEIPEGAPYASLPYLEREKAWADRAWTFIRENAASIPTMMGRRVARFALQSGYIPREGLAGWLQLYQPFYYFFLLISALAGSLWLILRKRTQFLRWVVLLLLPALVISALLYGEARFRVPFHPLFACLAALFYGSMSSRRALLRGNLRRPTR